MILLAAAKSTWGRFCRSDTVKVFGRSECSPIVKLGRTCHSSFGKQPQVAVVGKTRVCSAPNGVVKAMLHSLENVSIWADSWNAPQISILCSGNGPVYNLTPAEDDWLSTTKFECESKIWWSKCSWRFALQCRGVQYSALLECGSSQLGLVIHSSIG